MNYCTEAIEFFRHLSGFKAYDKLDGRSFQLVTSLLTKGEKYLLPENGDVGININSVEPSMFQYVRPPFPITIFEYADSNDVSAAEKARDEFFGTSVSGVAKSSKRITIVLDLESDMIAKLFGKAEKNSVMVIAANFIDEDKMWQITPIAGIINIKNNEPAEFKGTNGATYLGWDIEVFELFPKTIEMAVEKFGAEVKNDFSRDLNDDLRIAVCALIASNCRNVEEISTTISAKLNKKREKNGKAPFFSYRILDIFLKDARALPSGGGRRSAAIKAALTSPAIRLHGVRGHFKKRKTGIFWWRNHIRGDKAQGIVAKDYRVIKEK